MNNTVIRLDNVSKVYKLYEKPTDRLKEALHPRKKKYYKEFHALDNLSFSINKGECVGIIGKNGAGKSTLLKLITGVLSATTGSIYVDGKVSALLELGAGFNPELTGIENVYFNGMVLGMSKKEIDEKMDDILAFADIGEHVHQPVKTYSSGMFVRLAFSVAVSVNPEILIVDEALAVGDVRFRQKALRKMKEQMEKAKAILFVTHDMESIKNFCNRVIWLKDGSIYEEGEPKDVIQRYYNYMTHDIITNDIITNDNDMSIMQHGMPPSTDDGNIKWNTLNCSEIVGGNGVTVNKVALLVNGKPDTSGILNGNEEIEFLVEVDIHQNINQPLFGFGVFNQYGVPIIHFNSCNIDDTQLRQLQEGERIVISVKCIIPKLQQGTYTISIGFNDGTLEENVIIQHVRECYVLKMVPEGIQEKQHGLVIMENAEMQIINH